MREHNATIGSIQDEHAHPMDGRPFGCLLPSLDNFLFEFVVTTSVPLVVAAVLLIGSRGLQARAARLRAASGDAAGDASAALANFLFDISFFVVFVVFPSGSTLTFQYFGREVRDRRSNSGS